MAETKSKNKAAEKPERPRKDGHHSQNYNASGVPSRGGSRQGNIGHEGSQTSDDAHR